ncbi:MAG: hypothetical protein JSV74_00445 [Dehalococcoidia bacterium]|nr:MAG: hypothetical protein JSV74_00445 [Dehalococcoidia bacterium]
MGHLVAYLYYFSIGIIVLLVWVVMKVTKNRRTELKSNALDIAKGRCTKGEISRVEFD